MTRWAWSLVVAVVLVGGFVALAPHTDRHDAIIAQHERARDSLAVLAAHKLDSAQAMGRAADTGLVRVGEAKAARAAIVLPPVPPLTLMAADSVEIDGERVPVDPRLMRELRALVAHDAALHRLLAADSLTISRQDALIDLRTRQAAQATAAALGFRAALAESDSALVLTKDALTAERRRTRTVAVVAAVAVVATLWLRR